MFLVWGTPPPVQPQAMKQRQVSKSVNGPLMPPYHKSASMLTYGMEITHHTYSCEAKYRGTRVLKNVKKNN